MKILIGSLLLAALGFGSLQIASVSRADAALDDAKCEAEVTCTGESTCRIDIRCADGRTCWLELECDGNQCRVVDGDCSGDGPCTTPCSTPSDAECENAPIGCTAR